MTPGAAQRILVVDDYEPGRYAMGRLLRQAGFEISEAGTGREALRRISQERPDLVLLDVRLPDIPGVEVCRRIKSSPETSTTLVLQMSASAVDDGARVAALEAGADGYVTTPVEIAVLVATVRSLLRIRTAEQALHEASVEWQVTFDAIRDGVALLDSPGFIRRSNSALPALLGCEPGELAGQSLDRLFPPSDGEPLLAVVLKSHRRTSLERVAGERTFNITIDPIVDAGDQLRGGVAIITDITEHKQLDQQLRHSQKLESIGLLAGGVAHDFNNMLMGVLGNASLALECLDEPEKTRELLGDVVRASERAAELTRQLLAYAGKGRFLIGPVDLSQLIHDLAPLIQPSIPRSVELSLDLDPHLPPIQADKTQIEQLVMNLIINAGEAIKDGDGSVIISTSLRRVEADELKAYLTEHPEEGNYVILSVRDTGTGMDPETLKRIFDPFFSTKFLGRGLGLSAALGIIRGHKGAIRVSSAPGRGTAFEVLLPAGADVYLQAAPREQTGIVQGRGTILAVDDEEIVRTFLAHSLTRAGYEVLLAHNGQEALRIFAKNAHRISLVLLDLVMPVMSGEAVLPHLLNMQPNVRIIVSSGQDEEDCMRKLREPRVAGFLAKPYTPSALTAKVHEIMGAPATASVGSERQ